MSNPIAITLIIVSIVIALTTIFSILYEQEQQRETNEQIKDEREILLQDEIDYWTPINGGDPPGIRLGMENMK